MTETRIRVVLDTSRAKAELRDLAQDGKKSAERVGANVRGAIGRGLGAGVGFAVGAAGISQVAKSGAGDIVGNAFAGVGAQITDFLFQGQDVTARAEIQAREATFNAFQANPGNGDQAFEMFNQLKSVYQQREQGRRNLETDERFGTGADLVGDLVNKSVDRIVDAIKDGFDSAVKTITGGL